MYPWFVPYGARGMVYGLKREGSQKVMRFLTEAEIYDFGTMFLQDRPTSSECSDFRF
jgi:hypothetical protein